MAAAVAAVAAAAAAVKSSAPTAAVAVGAAGVGCASPVVPELTYTVRKHSHCQQVDMYDCTGDMIMLELVKQPELWLLLVIIQEPHTAGYVSWLSDRWLRHMMHPVYPQQPSYLQLNRVIKWIHPMAYELGEQQSSGLHSQRADTPSS